MLSKKEVLNTVIVNRTKIIENFKKGSPYKISDEKLMTLENNLEYFKEQYLKINPFD